MTNLYEHQLEELSVRAKAKHPSLETKATGQIFGTIEECDVHILKNIVIEHRPAVIFEIGTWIGTSSLVMKLAMEEAEIKGEIYTCDINDYAALPAQTRINILQESSVTALDHIPLEKTINMVFVDGELDFATLRKLLPRLSDNVRIVMHDYTLPCEKGVLNFIRLQWMSAFTLTFTRPEKIDPLTSIIIVGRRDDKTFSAENWTRSRIQVGLYVLKISLFAVNTKVLRKFNGYYKRGGQKQKIES